MAVSVERFLEYVNANANTDVDKAREILDVATLLVENYVLDNEVPEQVLNLAIVRVGDALWNQQHVPSQSGNTYYETEQAPAPTNRDPMTTAYIILRKYVFPW